MGENFFVIKFLSLKNIKNSKKYSKFVKIFACVKQQIS